MSSIFKRIIFVMAVVTTLLFLSLLIAAWYLGAFASVDLNTTNKPVRFFVATSGTGPYKETLEQLKTLQKYISDHSLPAEIPAVFLYDNPLNTPLPQVATRAVYLLADSVQIEQPYRLFRLPSRKIVSAAIAANPAIAPYKTYPAIREWCERYQLRTDTRGIIIEFYKDDGRVVVEFPVLEQ